jgi:hypothetical protein
MRIMFYVNFREKKAKLESMELYTNIDLNEIFKINKYLAPCIFK